MAVWSVPGISRWLSWESAFLESLGACWYMMSSGHRGSTDLLRLPDLALHLSFQNLEMGSLPASEALVTSLSSAGRQPGPGCSGVCCWCMVVYGHCLSTRGWAAVGCVSGVCCSDELVEHVVYSYRTHSREIRPQAHILIYNHQAVIRKYRLAPCRITTDEPASGFHVISTTNNTIKLGHTWSTDKHSPGLGPKPEVLWTAYC